MFFPIIPDVGIDINQIALVEKVEREITQAQMKSDLVMFVQYLVAGNDAWGKWGGEHSEDLPKYRVWFRKAVHMQGRVIPSMAFDFEYMSSEQIQNRFLMIKTVVLELISQVPKLSTEKV